MQEGRWISTRRYPQQWLDDLYQRADIVEIVSRYVPLKKNGSRYWGCCPFHHEKTPSFAVSPDVNLYYCFGCKAGGNVIQFVMEMEKLTYPEAIEYVANQLHMPVPELREDPGYEERRALRDRLLAANKAAAKWYHEQLWTPEGKHVLDYFYSRGLSDGILRRFGLGASLPQRDKLLNALREQGFSTEDIVLAGLAVQKDDQPPHDFFRNRAMFPIIDQFGSVLAFGGRSLDGSLPKYLNTGDTPVFNKRKGVYAANLLKKERQLKRVLLVEGYMDVVAVTQAGIHGAAATLGTSLTPEQAKLLSRFAPEVHVAYDGDEPGQHAIEKALGIFQQEQIAVKAVYLPDGLDPDEMIRQRGLEAFEALAPMAPTRYMLMRLEKISDFDSDEGRIKYVKEACNLLNTVSDPVEIEVYLRQISRKSGFDREVIVAQLSTQSSQLIRRSQNAPVQKRIPRTASAPSDADESEKTLIRIMAAGPLPEGLVHPEDFQDPELKSLAELLLAGRLPAQIISDATDEQRSKTAELLSGNNYENESDRLQAASDCLKNMRARRMDSQFDRLKAQLSGATDEERRELLRKMVELQATRKH